MLLNLIILFSLCYISILVEGQTVVVLDRGELFVGKLNLSVGEQKHLVLSDHWAVFPGCFLSEKGRLNLSAILVNHLDVHESPLSTIILPPSWLIFFDDTSPDFPVS